MMTKDSKIEERAYTLGNLETRDDTEAGTGTVEGDAIVFDSETCLWDDVFEVIERGALDNTDLKDVPLFINHNRSMVPVARSRNNNAHSTMQLSITDTGLHIRATLDTAGNPQASELYSAIKRGDISGMSFAFVPDSVTWDTSNRSHAVRHVNSIKKVCEVSAVTYPAYEATSISARSLDSVKAELDSLRNEDELKALREKVIAMCEERGK